MENGSQYIGRQTPNFQAMWRLKGGRLTQATKLGKGSTAFRLEQLPQRARKDQVHFGWISRKDVGDLVGLEVGPKDGQNGRHGGAANRWPGRGLSKHVYIVLIVCRKSVVVGRGKQLFVGFA